jgi:hypothetical protein
MYVAEQGHRPTVGQKVVLDACGTTTWVVSSQEHDTAVKLTTEGSVAHNLCANYPAMCSSGKRLLAHTCRAPSRPTPPI